MRPHQTAPQPTPERAPGGRVASCDVTLPAGDPPATAPPSGITGLAVSHEDFARSLRRGGDGRERR
jgi:hypothetical protein